VLHFSAVPTSRPRHTITETPPVQEALDELRSALSGGERIDFGELLSIGARTKARRLRAEDAQARTARVRLAEMIRTRSIPVDLEAAQEVKQLGLIAGRDE
jgi:hypothetical protein